MAQQVEHAGNADDFRAAKNKVLIVIVPLLVFVEYQRVSIRNLVALLFDVRLAPFINAEQDLDVLFVVRQV